MSLTLLMGIVFLASLLLTMVGLGGGLIFAPLFILLKYPVSTAVTASLFLNGIAAFSAALVYWQKKMIDFRLGLPLLVTSMLCAPLGALLTTRIDSKRFTAIMATVIFLAALRMFFVSPPAVAAQAVSTLRRVVGGGLLGGVVGLLGGMLGIGGGVFIVPLLIFLLKVPTKTAAATSIFIVIFSSFSAFVTHIAVAQVDWRFIAAAAVFSLAGGQIGSRIMADRLKGQTVRRIFGLVLLAFAFKLIQQALS